MSKLPPSLHILNMFKEGLIKFFDELIDQFPEEADLVIARIFLKDQVPIKDVMDTFILKLSGEGIRGMINERNETFFLEHSLFDDLGDESVNHFKKLWMSGRLDDNDKEVVWRWIDGFVGLADRYSKVLSG